MADKTFITIKPPLKAIDNGDGTFSISIKDVNSEAILASILALRDAATLDDIEAAVEALRAVSTLDTVEAAIDAVLAGPLSIQFADGPAIDSFGRQRVSNPANLWTSEFQYNLHPLYFDKVTAVNGTVTHLPNESAASLAVTADDGSKAQMSTLEYFRYQAGKAQDDVMTFVADELASATVKFVRRTKTSGIVVDNKVPQSEWNFDQFDGNGPSGITLDITKGQILWIDLQWLSLGRIRSGFDIGGVLRYAHAEFGANVLTVPTISTANLPVRWEIVTDATKTTMRIGYFDDDNGVFLEIQGTAAIATLKAICSTVFSEGGVDEELGHTFSGGNGKTFRTGIGATTPVPICSIRPATTLNSIVNRTKWRLENIEIIADDAMFWELHYKPSSITGATFAIGPVTHSAVEVDIAGTAIADAVVIASGYIEANKKGGIMARDIRSKYPFALDSAGTDQSRGLSIVVVTMGGSNKKAAGQFNFVEIR